MVGNEKQKRRRVEGEPWEAVGDSLQLGLYTLGWYQGDRHRTVRHYGLLCSLILDLLSRHGQTPHAGEAGVYCVTGTVGGTEVCISRNRKGNCPNTNLAVAFRPSKRQSLLATPNVTESAVRAPDDEVSPQCKGLGRVLDYPVVGPRAHDVERRRVCFPRGD